MAENHTTDLLSILVGARAELRDRWDNYRDEFGARGDEPHDVVHEIADSSVPVYTGELLELACSDASLATDAAECGQAFDGSPTPVNIIAANVYERLTADLFEEFERIETKASENLDAILAGRYIPTGVSDAERCGRMVEDAVQAAATVEERERVCRLAARYWEQA